MNRLLLLWLVVMTALTTVGCFPRHPPHTPQPLGAEEMTGTWSWSVIQSLGVTLRLPTSRHEG